MEQKKCKWCGELKDITKFSKYKTNKGTVLVKSTCISCYNNKYHPWIKKPFGVNKMDSRFNWKMASEKEKLDHLKLVFESNVIKKDGCWDWKGKLHHSGYGVIQWNGKQIGAHQASYIIHKGEIPNGEWVLHTCDNKRCTSPFHLYLGTAVDNAFDREHRNRRPKLIGKYHPNAVLNERKVKNIKKLFKKGVPVSEIARRYMCGKSTIEAIKNGWTWKHVTIRG